ncbi:MAG: D-xylose transporter subunit XylF, partial [Bacteroidota bacterium]
MLKKSPILFLIILLFCFTISGCIWWQQVAKSNPIRSHPIKIGLSMATLQEERWRRDCDYFTERVKQLGGEVIAQNANNDDQEQLQ